MDLVVRCAALPRAGETLLGGPFATYPGGKGANQAVAAARAGAMVSFIGAHGADAYGGMLRDVLRGEGVDLAHVDTRADVPTGVALITVSSAGENTIVVAPGANASVSNSDVHDARVAIQSADVLLMQMETPLATLESAAELARDAYVAVILNAAPAQPLPANLRAAVDVLIVNETEAGVVAPGSSAATPEPLGLLGIETVVLTLGAAGVRLVREQRVASVPAFPVNPVDTVGAGDAFCGVFACRWAEHRIGGGLDAGAITDCLHWAAAAGALATQTAGAIPSLPTRNAVIAMLRSTPLPLSGHPAQ